jgi:hypothetical protein
MMLCLHGQVLLNLHGAYGPQSHCTGYYSDCAHRGCFRGIVQQAACCQIVISFVGRQPVSPYKDKFLRKQEKLHIPDGIKVDKVSQKLCRRNEIVLPLLPSFFILCGAASFREALRFRIDVITR